MRPENGILAHDSVHFLTVLTQANSGECQAHPRQQMGGRGGGKITEEETESDAQGMRRLNQCAKQAAH